MSKSEQQVIEEQIEIIDKVCKSITEENEHEYWQVRDGLYFAFFKSNNTLKDEFLELFTFDQIPGVITTLNAVQKGAGFSTFGEKKKIFGAGGELEFDVAKKNLNVIKSILSKKNQLLKGDDGSFVKVKEESSKLGDIEAKDEKGLPLLIKDLLFVCRKMQGNPFYIKKDIIEDNRNTYIKSMMELLGYNIQDQTLHGISPKGKGPGKPDLLIEEKNTKRKIVVEALILDGLNTKSIETHFNKVFKYDTYGNNYNIEIVYCNVTNLNKLKEQYEKVIKNFESASNPPYKIENIKSDSSRIVILKSYQKINQIDNYLFHLLIQFNDK